MSPSPTAERSRLRLLAAVLMAVALLAAACSGDDGDSEESGSDESSEDTAREATVNNEPTEAFERREATGCGPDDPEACVTVNDGAPASDRYTLFNVVSENDTGTYLVDGTGQILNSWNTNGVDVQPLLEPGAVLNALEEPGPNSPAQLLTFEAPCVAITQADGNVTWPEEAGPEAECRDGIEPRDITTDGDGNPSTGSHHDIQLWGDPVYTTPAITESTGDGRVLILSNRELAPEQSAPITDNTPLRDDLIVELDADGETVLWEWLSSDHVDELGFDDDARAAISELAGSNAGLPPILDKNGDPVVGQVGWLQTNTINYLGSNRHCPDPDGGDCDARFHPDNVMVGSRQAEVMFIVARHDDPDGEFAEGDVVWTLGPNLEDTEIGPISGQHMNHLIPPGLPGEGNLLVFDNGGQSGFGIDDEGNATNTLHPPRGASRVLEIDPITEELIWSYEQPEEGADGTPVLFAPNTSSAQRLANGNTLIAEGTTGRVLEVDEAGEIVWEMMTPFDALEIINAPPLMLSVSNYRSYRVDPAWVEDAGLIG